MLHARRHQAVGRGWCACKAAEAVCLHDLLTWLICRLQMIGRACPHHACLSSILQHIIPLHTSTGEAVMMGWETPLMQRHAAAICGAKRGTGDFLNVGFGLGIIDREIQAWAASQRDGVAPQPAACVHTLQRTLSDTSCCSLQGTPVCLRSAPTAIFVAPLPAVPN